MYKLVIVSTIGETMRLVGKFLIQFSLVISLSSCGSEDSQPLVKEQAATVNSVIREETQSLSEGYAAFRKSQISNPAYTLFVALAADRDNFTGEVDISFNLAKSNSSPITLDYDSGEVLEVSVNGNPAQWQYEKWFITLAPEQFILGQNTISIQYQRPFATDGAGLHKFTDPENGEVYLYTNFEPYDANRLFPHFDQPNLRAPLTLVVVAPSDWQVIANTREAEIMVQGDNNRWIFPASAPISSYIYALHAGPFEVWEDQAGDIPLRLFARTSLAPHVKIDDWFIPTKQSFAFFEDYFEVAYPFGKYDQIIVPDFNAGAMENAGAVTFAERFIRRGEKSTAQRRNLAYTIAHEMAHMWFGDLVTMDWWNGLWLNESFATYMGNLALERASNFENIWDAFYSRTKQWAYKTDQLVTTHAIELKVASTADAFTNFDGITYGKGASVLRQLAYFLGEENFRRGVSNYLKKYSYQNTSLNDFVSELGLAAKQDLSEWQQQWLYQSGVNTLEASFVCQDNVISSLQLIQSVPEVATADKILRSQRIQIGLYRYTDAQMVLSHTIPKTYAGKTTDVPEAIGQACPDMVFPNKGDWGFLKVKLDKISLATLKEHINDFDNSTIRIMLWQSLWDSVQDAKMPLTEFVEFALGNIGEEGDDHIVRQVADNLSSAFNLFSRLGHDQAENQGYKTQIEQFMWRQLDQSEAGSELQKIWFDNFTELAHNPEALDYLLTLLNEKATIEGLSIDQDKRWNIVVALNRYQHGDYKVLVAAEKLGDPSDKGHNMALSAEAIRPDKSTKQKWLNTIIDTPDVYKLASLRTVMAYLFPSEQVALQNDFSERILGEVPSISANADQGYIDAYVDILEHLSCTESSVARLAQANKDFVELQPVIVKAYKILHQEDERCMKIGKLMVDN